MTECILSAMPANVGAKTTLMATVTYSGIVDSTFLNLTINVSSIENIFMPIVEYTLVIISYLF